MGHPRIPSLDYRGLTIVALLIGTWSAVTAGPILSEFMASNNGGFYDEDGDSSDWLEVFNPDASPIDLGGHYLTDDPAAPTKWRLPSLSLAPGAFAIVFASGKDRNAGEWHTNFRLARTAGGQLALVAPDGTTVLSQFANYPEQFDGISYGLTLSGVSATSTTLVAEGDACKLIVPTSEIGLGWSESEFDDSGWLDATTGIGFERGSGYQNFIGPGGDILSQASDVNASAYCRIPFSLESTSGLTRLVLRMKCDDGFIAYLNGTRIAAVNAPATPAWNSAATADRPDAEALQFLDTDLTAQAGLLQPGLNMLAIHALNSSAGSSDMLMLPRLEAGFAASGTVTPGPAGYFQSPTPGAVPIGPQGLPSPVVTPSEPGRGFIDSLQLTLTTTSPAAQIRYTLDGSVPTAASTLYQGNPITLSATTLLRARSFEPGLTPGALTERAYIRLSANMQAFSSDLPVAVMNRIGTGTTAANGKTFAFFAFFEPDPVTGRTTLNRPYSLGTRGGWKVRGSSSAGFSKQAFSVEAWNEVNQNKEIAPFDMPPESDWILHGGSIYDPALVRNPYTYELSNQVGRYAVRTRFLELFKDDNAGDLNYSADYWGVYTLMEKITRDPNRVDVERLPAGATTEPAITGGYMLKIDRLDPGDGGLNAGGQSLGWVYPKESETTTPQVDYLRTYINNMAAALATDQRHTFIDQLSWIDHHLLNVLTLNADALRLSTYFFKRRGRPLEFGPVWDFDRSAGSTDGRDGNPSSWQGGTPYFDYPWWDALFDNEDFWQAYIDRYFALRDGPFATANVRSIIDGMAAELAESQVRNFQRWSEQPRFGGYQGEITHLKTWLGTRLSWMDAQFAPRPIATLAAGTHPPGTTVQLSAALRAGQKIFYTLDGTDPRPPFVAPTIDGTTLVSESAPVRAWVPTADLGTAWRTDPAFDDTLWLSGSNGVGYERSSGYGPYINIDVNTPMQAQTSCYVRIKFNVEAAEAADWNFLTLGVRYDDGFVAYLNGTQLIADRAPTPAAWNAAATQTHDDGAAVNFQNFDVSARLGSLRVGENLLAIHALNESAGSSDFLNQVRLIAGRRESTPGGDTRGVEYTGPIVLNQTSRLFARVFDPSGGHTTNSGQYPTGTGWSAPLVAEYLVNESPAAAGSLVLSEVMADPYDFAGVPDRQAFEWIEVHNVSAGPIALTGVALSGGIDFVFPPSSLAAGDRALVVKNRAAFEQVYGPARAAKIVGEFTRALDPLGETLVLTALNTEMIQSSTYPGNVARRGYSLVADGADWRESRSLLGSPGTKDPTTSEVPGVVVNEIIPNPAAPEMVRIELLNPSSQPADVSDWFLTNDLGSPFKFPLPALSPLAPGAFTIISQSDLPGWTSSPIGGEIYLVAATPTGAPLDYIDGFRFDATGPGTSFGRHILSTLDVHHVPLASASIGEANGEPLASPLVINEIHYHPPTDEGEFIEIYNRHTSAVPLAGVTIDGAGFTFPIDTPPLPASGLALLVEGNPDVFRAVHQVPDGVPVFGPMPASLANNGERLRVLMTIPSGVALPSEIQLAVDTADYSDQPPWPAIADGGGHSLHRIQFTYGGEPLHWTAGPPSPGSLAAPTTDWRTQFFSAAEIADPSLSGHNADPDSDGLPNFAEYVMGSHPRSSSSTARLNLKPTSNNTLEITFTLRSTATDFTADLQQSADLAGWLPAPNFIHTSSTPHDNGTTTITYTGPLPTQPLFFRLTLADTTPAG